MVKATLEFDLPEERNDFEMMSNASRAFIRLGDIDGICRGWLKHGHSFKTADEAIEMMRVMLMEDNLLDILQ